MPASESDSRYARTGLSKNNYLLLALNTFAGAGRAMHQNQPHSSGTAPHASSSRVSLSSLKPWIEKSKGSSSSLHSVQVVASYPCGHRWSQAPQSPHRQAMRTFVRVVLWSWSSMYRSGAMGIWTCRPVIC